MKGEDLFRGLNEVDPKFIEEAETVTHLQGERKLLSLRRPVLVAAIIAMLLMLVGCTVVYLLRMRDLKLGEQTVTYEVFDYDPKTGNPLAPAGVESQTQQILTLAGLSGTPAFHAAREWYEFTETYDPDRAIKHSVWGKEPEFPEEYDGYNLYTQEMKDRLDQILEKYHLKLRGEQIRFQTPKLMMQALGIKSLLNPGAEARMNVGSAHYYENGELSLFFDITIPDEEKAQGYLYYLPKDCFIPDTAVLTEGNWEEWNYTTAAGDPVLILRAEESASAWFFCDTGNYTVSMRLEIVRDISEEIVDGVPVAQFQLMTKEQLEQVADAVDFSLEPKLTEGWENLSDNAVSAGQEINGYTIEPVSAFTDGYGYQIILKITAPECIALTDPENHNVHVSAGSGVYGRSSDDEDGKLNTCYFILEEYTSSWDYPEDGSKVYPVGHIIPVYWEDLYLYSYDPETMKSQEELLTEGTWKFDIPLNDWDPRQIELLTEPITAKACVGWKMDGTDVLEDLEVTSITLRALGIRLTHEDVEGSPDFFCWTGVTSRIVMQDGSHMEFTGGSGFEKPIDLDQVAYIQLADKTILPMPGVQQGTVNSIAETFPLEPQDLPMIEFEGGMELLSEPITMQSLAGYATDATGDMDPLYEYFTITSAILHPEGLALVGTHAFDFPEEQATVVMKDGREILLTGMNGAPYCFVSMSQLKAESAIDVSQAARILLPDGTELMVPDPA